MKIGLGVGATLNLGNYNSGRVRVDFEDEYLEKEFVFHVQDTSDPLERIKVADAMTDDIYTFVENKLMQKIEAFITRLENEGYTGS